MIVNSNDNIKVAGHLTINKVFKDGSEELVFDDKNVIVSGFGWSLAALFTGLGSTNILDYQIDRFQLGVSGSNANQVSSTYQLSGPLSSITEYIGNGVDSNLHSFLFTQYLTGVATQPNVPFAKIPASKITKIDDRSVRYTILVDEDSCNNISRNGVEKYLNEIGLFIKNPYSSLNASVLVAYRYFSEIRKTDDFGLIFRWTITFG